MKRLFVILSVLASSAGAASGARAADRLSDRDVKALVERVDEERDKFVDAADDNFKKAVIRSSTGEVDVKRVLDDFEKAIEHLKDRLTPEYSASTEAASVLRQATSLDQTVQAQSPAKGASEWHKLTGDLNALAAAYGTTFPLAANAPVRRIGDRELAQAAEKLAGVGDQTRKSLESDLKKDKSVDEQTRKALLAQVEEWTKASKTLEDRVKDGQPSSAEAERVLQGGTALGAAIAGRQAPGARSAFHAAASLLQTVAQAYGQKPSS